MLLFTMANMLLAFGAAVGLFPRYTGAWLYVFGMPIGVVYSYFVYVEKKWRSGIVLVMFGLLLWPIVQQNVLLYTGFVTAVGMSITILPNLGVCLKNNRVLEWIGKNSFFIYLCEAVVIDTIGFIFPRMNRY